MVSVPFVLLIFLLGAVNSQGNVVTVCKKNNGDFFLVQGTQVADCANKVATAKLDDQRNSTGWGFLQVETMSHVSMQDQAYAAGLAEGQVTKELIYYNLLNTVDGYCDGAAAFCQRFGIYMLKNFLWMQEKIKNASTLSTSSEDYLYWQQVNFTLNQLQGVIDGYEGSKIESNRVTVHPIYMLQLMGDHKELEAKLHKPTNVNKTRRSHSHCSALIKTTRHNADLLVSHVTWTSYSSMVRLQKVYGFQLNDNFPGNVKTMSGYPGTLASIDDFVLLSSGLAVLETTIENHNRKLFSSMTPLSVMTWIRSQVAHRMANDGPVWAKIFSRYNSGTYNNQWMIVNFRAFKPHQRLPKNGILYVLEQMPGLIEHGDMTKTLQQKGYWPSYNRAYFPRVFNVSGSWEMVRKYGEYFSYEMAPRGQIFRRDQHKVTDMESLEKLMRYNDYKNDPISRCNCTPPYSADKAISSRSDLNPSNGSYPFPELGFLDQGATDMKATDIGLMADLRFRAIAGPTHDPLPVFDWNTSALRQTVAHYGQPTVWNFSSIVHRWPAFVQLRRSNRC